MKLHLNPVHRLGVSLPLRVAIVRSLPGLGDLLCIIPAMRALRAALPEAQLTLIGLPWSVQFVQRFNHYFNDWLEFPGCPGIPEVPLSPQRIVAFLAQVQQSPFDLALQMHGNGSLINSFTLLLGAKMTAGFFPKGQYCPDRDRFLPYPNDEPEIRRPLRLLEFLGIPLQGEQLEFPLWASDWQAFEAIASRYKLQLNRYICIHPGASTSDRRWSPNQFAAVADALAADGYQIVLTGTQAEADLTKTVAQLMQYPAVDLAGVTSLGSLAALLKQAQLLICNDTGVSHLAAALNVNSVVIFSNSELHRWAPLDRQRHRIIDNRHATAASRLSEAPVLAEARALLQQEVVYAS